MISQQPTSQQKFQIMQIDFDDQNDEELQSTNENKQTQPLSDQHNQPQNTSKIKTNSQQPTQINSLQSFQKKILSPEKRPATKPSIRQKSPQSSELSVDQISSQFRSLNTMSRSQVEFINFSKREEKSMNENDSVLEEKWSDSPEKLIKRKFNNARVNRGARVSLVWPQVEMLGRCYQLLDHTYVKLDMHPATMPSIHKFLHTPLPSLDSDDYMRYIFEIHFYKFQFTFHTYFEFYLRNSQGEMVHLLKSQKDGLSVSSSHLLYAVDPHDVNRKEFAAKLKYNTLKTEYNMYDVDEKGQKEKNVQRQLLATVFYDKKFNQKRQLAMYIPKHDYRSDKFIKSQQNNNLAAFYNSSEGSLTRKIQKLQTVEIPKQQQQQVRGQLSLKNSGRRILLMNEQKVERFYMGKRQDDRYIIVAAAGMTPLEVFMLGVVNLEH